MTDDVLLDELKFNFYSGDAIRELDAHYNVVFGERSNGKTTDALKQILRGWLDEGKKGAYIRRYDEEIKGAKAKRVWSTISNELGLVDEWTDGKYTTIEYYASAWYLAKWDEKLQRNIKQGTPFCHAFALNNAEHYKGTSYPEVQTIVFDEFITRSRYLVNEFVEFNNLLSTIIRQRTNVEIYLLGNTVNKFCPYFDEMGLTNVPKMKQGAIDLYEYDTYDSNGELQQLKVAVEYASSTVGGKKSDIYFAFDNPKLNMITSGSWELPMYPHAPFKIKDSNILELFFIKFRDATLQGNIIMQDDSFFIYIHEKTTPIKDEEKQIYSLEFNPRHNRGMSIINNPRNRIAVKIAELFKLDLVYYQNNNVGELVRNYVHETDKLNGLNL